MVSRVAMGWAAGYGVLQKVCFVVYRDKVSENLEITTIGFEERYHKGSQAIWFAFYRVMIKSGGK